MIDKGGNPSKPQDESKKQDRKQQQARRFEQNTKKNTCF
jgi:hypothetical protein